jgi:hypothetical protein
MEIITLKEKESSNSDAVATLSERVMELVKEIELLKKTKFGSSNFATV